MSERMISRTESVSAQTSISSWLEQPARNSSAGELMSAKLDVESHLLLSWWCIKKVRCAQLHKCTSTPNVHTMKCRSCKKNIFQNEIVRYVKCRFATLYFTSHNKLLYTCCCVAHTHVRISVAFAAWIFCNNHGFVAFKRWRNIDKLLQLERAWAGNLRCFLSFYKLSSSETHAYTSRRYRL